MRIKGIIKAGYGVASGKGKDERYPEGTLKRQFKYFLELGLDLSNYFMGTINLDISPYTYELGEPKHFFEEINWSKHIPPENFYFFDVSLHFQGKVHQGLIYMPDPKTKEEHVQKPSILELLLPKVEGLNYGQAVDIEINEHQLNIIQLNIST
ncbi:hypothetical protein ACFSQJ_15495 [Croceitalea marina]|uniref:Uncharacterized protein n=1 Tax=Croceitalea marina TaxID=1775166 RepID=A0ABW5MZU3_9FLAO